MSSIAHARPSTAIALGFPQHTLPGCKAEIVASQRMQTGSFTSLYEVGVLKWITH